jgi:TRAP-type C4-dicarboxylate transport system permease large subunit
LITPPVGCTLLVGCAASGLCMEKVVGGPRPFYLVMLVALFLIVYVLPTTLWFPKTFLG